MVELGGGRVVGFEIALQWTDPDFGTVPPDRFIPIAEDTGLIHAIMTQALAVGCEAAHYWPTSVTLGIGVLPGQLKDPTLPSRILGVLDSAGIAHDRLEVEITESTLVQDIEAAQATLGVLQAAGVRIVLGKFGTGYSNLYHLRAFKLDKIKIDRRFVAAMGNEAESARIVNALVGLGRGLGVTVSAEGGEDAAQRAALRAAGCAQAQPADADTVPAAATMALLHRRIAAAG